MLLDNFGRHINYLRLSITDRCDFRCVYCMTEKMSFAPRQQLLTTEEISHIAQAFVELGVQKIRLTGGEPLIRRDIGQLLQNLGQLSGLQELTLTTNGSQLSQYARQIRQAGVKRINVSLDSLQADRFRTLTRTGDLNTVIRGIGHAHHLGLKIKLNSVILKNRNRGEVIPLVDFAIKYHCDIRFIEEMPLGVISEHQRKEEFISSEELRHIIEQRYELSPAHNNDAHSGPARYWKIKGHNSKIGFISPHSDNFCPQCNRIRVTATGQLLLCLGNEDAVNLKAIVRRHPKNTEHLKSSIVDAIKIKPEKHQFTLDNKPQILRFMSSTGG